MPAQEKVAILADLPALSPEPGLPMSMNISLPDASGNSVNHYLKYVVKGRERIFGASNFPGDIMSKSEMARFIFKEEAIKNSREFFTPEDLSLSFVQGIMPLAEAMAGDIFMYRLHDSPLVMNGVLLKISGASDFWFLINAGTCGPENPEYDFTRIDFIIRQPDEINKFFQFGSDFSRDSGKMRTSESQTGYFHLHYAKHKFVDFSYQNNQSWLDFIEDKYLKEIDNHRNSNFQGYMFKPEILEAVKEAMHYGHGILRNLKHQYDRYRGLKVPAGMLKEKPGEDGAYLYMPSCCAEKRKLMA